MQGSEGMTGAGRGSQLHRARVDNDGWSLSHNQPGEKGQNPSLCTHTPLLCPHALRSLGESGRRSVRPQAAASQWSKEKMPSRAPLTLRKA